MPSLHTGAGRARLAGFAVVDWQHVDTRRQPIAGSVAFDLTIGLLG
ncbi:hypothetical protein GCM10010399_67670 [Dactylosporangium fulvum]|uniref:Uncharacterized protein n=1 Tax=Dactylosporangium fulvum TaxID=53359 RepID=A0ABY5VMY8_9ACTN|nr:hypothetical protein [Dactylosporangium fulvum]UWP78805.1 hypothetical protein Dfulv_26930 [Dactylosporangium fulvum]